MGHFGRIAGRSPEVARTALDELGSRNGTETILHDVGLSHLKRGRRVHLERTADHVALLRTECGNGAALGVVDRHVALDLEPLLDLVARVDLAGDTVHVVLRTGDHTVVIHIGKGGEVVATVVAALGTDGVALEDTGLEDLVNPVRVRTIPLREHGATADRGLEVDELLRVHDIHAGGVVLQRDGSVEEDAAFAGLALLRRDEDDTVTSLGTVDSSGSSILQNLDGLHVVGIDVVDVAHLHTVDDVQRVGCAGGVGGVTADADARTCTRSTGAGEDRNAGGLTHQGFAQAFGHAGLKLFRLDGSNRTGNVALSLDGITDDDRLFHHLGVLEQRDVNHGPATHGDSLGLVAQAGNFQGRIRGHVGQRIRTVGLGNRTVRGTAYQNGCTDHRSSALISNFTCDSLLCKSARNHSDH